VIIHKRSAIAPVGHKEAHSLLTIKSMPQNAVVGVKNAISEMADCFSERIDPSHRHVA
jgi:hypothetical protein